jgi:hypothetical protein
VQHDAIMCQDHLHRDDILYRSKSTHACFIDGTFARNSRYLDQAGILELSRRGARGRWHVGKLGQEFVQCGHPILYRGQLRLVERNVLGTLVKEVIGAVAVAEIIEPPRFLRRFSLPQLCDRSGPQ